MKRSLLILFVIILSSVPLAHAQQDDEAVRIKTREKLAQLLEKAGPEVKISFAQSKKQPFNYIGSLTTGLSNAESLEIVVAVTAKDTIGFRVYPHYRGGYINPAKVKDPAGLLRLLLRLSDRGTFVLGNG